MRANAWEHGKNDCEDLRFRLLFSLASKCTNVPKYNPKRSSVSIGANSAKSLGPNYVSCE